MSTNRTCCCCLSLRTGCIIIGVLAILVDIFAIRIFHWGAIISLIADVSLITGAFMRIRDCLLPSMILGIVTNVVLWITAILTLFIPTMVLAFSYPDGRNNEIEALFAVIAIGIVLFAIVHMLIIRKIFQHFHELDGKQSGQFLPTAIRFALVPGATTVDSHRTVDTNIPYGKLWKICARMATRITIITINFRLRIRAHLNLKVFVDHY